MKNFFLNLWNSIKAFFTRLYNKDLVSLDDITAYITTKTDYTADEKLSANDFWKIIKKLINK